MPLYVCDCCQCIENTAMGTYWYNEARGLPVLCTECDPSIEKWHGEFEKKPFTEDRRGDVLNPPERKPENATS